MGNRPELISEVVRKVIENLGGEKRKEEEHLLEVWRKVVGRKMARCTEPVSIRGDRLIVNVSSPGCSYQLNLQKEEILAKLQKRLKNLVLKDIQFRVS
jgi:predicted nucleic acid-binding Zn ribbon protein